MVGFDGSRNVLLLHEVSSEEHERVWRPRDVSLRESLARRATLPRGLRCRYALVGEERFDVGPCGWVSSSSCEDRKRVGGVVSWVWLNERSWSDVGSEGDGLRVDAISASFGWGDCR